MGTRADFYVGIGPSAEWIGSTSFDGDPEGLGAGPLAAQDETSFRAEVEAMLTDPSLLTTRPSEGWPWPWEDSRTSDFAYAWTDRGPLLSAYGHQWCTLADYLNPDERVYKLPKLGDDEVVDMRKRAMSSEGILAKSGLIIITSPK
jgi:hypothetical protein